jgi:hypothetical protein
MKAHFDRIHFAKAMKAAKNEPYSEKTNHMSRSGYLRWKYYQIYGKWLSPAQIDSTIEKLEVLNEKLEALNKD